MTMAGKRTKDRHYVRQQATTAYEDTPSLSRRACALGEKAMASAGQLVESAFIKAAFVKSPLQSSCIWLLQIAACTELWPFCC